MVGITIKEVSVPSNPPGCGIKRIPVTIPDGYRRHGAGYCINITEIAFDYGDVAQTAQSWTGYPFVSLKH